MSLQTRQSEEHRAVLPDIFQFLVLEATLWHCNIESLVMYSVL